MDNNILVKVLDYIDAHIYEKITLGELAELVGYSPFYFSKLFSVIPSFPTNSSEPGCRNKLQILTI